MPFHVQISGQGFSLKVGNRYNLTADDVVRDFVMPWEADSEIVVSGRVFRPSESEVEIREGRELSAEELRELAVWMKLTDHSDVVTDRFIVHAPGSRTSTGGTEVAEALDPRRVAVVHGRDDATKDAMFAFLRDLDLRPLEWIELIRATGSAAPQNRTVVQRLFDLAAAVVVLLTPEDEVRLHPDLTPNPDQRGEGEWVCQPRPNVLLEAGMALALHPDRTVLVEVGVVRLPSDLDGVNVVRLDGTAPPLHDLASRLSAAGCATSTDGNDWLQTKRFALLQSRTRLPAS